MLIKYNINGLNIYKLIANHQPIEATELQLIYFRPITFRAAISEKLRSDRFIPSKLGNMITKASTIIA